LRRGGTVWAAHSTRARFLKTIKRRKRGIVRHVRPRPDLLYELD
jgi:hypothetical protein